ncbi:hypothetical protein QAD02_019595 [Eretmocerus hayati]|uniref:Uncharacterized protein n=1 Tax=Eretmocerus hayati TaxID=131215 RepID=A0ACC2PL83_9HYME|nr:hypothetical protein QAD02_019595 [Eretmocerus hayati]
MALGAFWLLFGCAGTLCIALALQSKGILRSLASALLVAIGLRRRVKILTTDLIQFDVTNTTRLKKLPGPWNLPVIGSLHKLGSPGGPFEAFSQLAREYGDIYEMQLGSSKCVVVSGYPLIREVLITKGNHFGGRPNFTRWHHLFGGNRNNSLALCDWSEVQRKRRSIARKFCSPRGGSTEQERISRVAFNETSRLLDHLNAPENASILRGESPIKPAILTAIGNMFTEYMCSIRFGYSDDSFNGMVRTFDEIFWDINQGYALDFLPWLEVFYTKHLARMRGWSVLVREFIIDKIIEPKRATLDLENEIPRDFADALLLNLECSEPELSWEHIKFELEDFLGGHSAVGNLVMMVLVNVVTYPSIQKKIQEECDQVLRQKKAKGQPEFVLTSDRFDMPYTEAVIWETLRISSSPIVPHVATCDTDIGGFSIHKDSIVFLNNYGLNLGEDLWGEDVREFKPERFITTVIENNVPVRRVSKPEHFVPFSTGKRTCIGQKLVQGFAFVVLTLLMSKFDISSPKGEDVRSSIQPSCLALPPDCFNLVLSHRKSTSSENEQ